MSDEHFLSRWSKKKIEARKGESVPASEAGTTPSISQPAILPPVESLTPNSDFAAFMRPQVDDLLKRRALKTLFQDPRFNVMDGLDVYIDDYSKPDPLPEGWLEKMNQVARLGAPREVEEEAGAKAGAQPVAESPKALEGEPSAAAGEPVEDEQGPEDSRIGNTSSPSAGVTDS